VNRRKNKSQQQNPRPQWQIDTLVARIENVEKQRADAGQEDRDYKQRQLNFNAWLVWLNVGTVLVAMISVFVAIYQSYIAKRSASADEGATRAAIIANDTSIASQRAFLNYRSILPISSVIDSKTGMRRAIEFHPGWFNSGSTPALNARHYVGFHATDTKKTAGYKFPEVGDPKDERPFIVGPQESTQMVPMEIRLIDLERIGRGRFIYIYGYVTYRDIFPGTKVRLTEFCHELVNVRNETSNKKPIFDRSYLSDPSENVNAITVDCGWYSCYDEDCPDYARAHKRQVGRRPGPAQTPAQLRERRPVHSIVACAQLPRQVYYVQHL
jgi:hypothetical protein